jgi:isopenicillin-N epimerase
MIDGAHSLGQIDLNLSEIDADFYVTNGHKWFCNNRGCGILYVKESHQKYVKPTVLSWGNNQGFHSEFIWQGNCVSVSGNVTRNNGL